MRADGLDREKLIKAIREIEKGLHDGDLGGHLIKKRIARPGKGKSGGFRTIIVYSKGKKSFFVYGFPKNEKDNLDDVELENLKELAKLYLEFSDADLAKALEKKELEELEEEADHDEEIQK
jgi:hypothetical protein